MRPFIYIFMLCFLGVLLAGNSFASICDQKESLIFFGNGVIADEDDAYNAKNIIKNRLQVMLPPEEFEVLDFKLAYNDTYTLPLDFLESAIQLLTVNISGIWRYFWNLDPMPDLLADKLTLLSTVLDYSALLTTDSLKDHVRTYKTAIAEGKKVILVAHSQGNFFGNQAYNLLKPHEQQSFSMVSVANVDSNVLGNASDAAPYTTLVNDKFILAIIAAQLGLPTGPMFPNTENLGDPENFLNHSFVDSYMVEGSVSYNQIISDILVTLANLPAPYQIVDPGVITVSLSWDSAPDIDLHVYEPNGMHVCWYDQEGFSGSLDRDDRSASGLEHYRVLTCDTLEKGGYRIALDYFKGDYPEVATLQINAGLLSRTIEVSMPSEMYGSSNYPVPVAGISVYKTENNDYEFLIHE